MSSAYTRNRKTLKVLKETLHKLESDHEKTPTMLELRKILLKRIMEIEAEMKAQS